MRQERESTSRTRLVVRHLNSDHFVVNTHSLHNYRAISQALPASHKIAAYKVEDEAKLRVEASKQIRSRRQKESSAKQDLLAAEIVDRATADINGESTTGPEASHLLDSLANDRDLVDVIQGLIGRGEIPDDDQNSHGDGHNDFSADQPVGSVGLAQELPSEASGSGTGPAPIRQIPLNPVFLHSSKSKSANKTVLHVYVSSFASATCDPDLYCF